jgi:hypothetical protein
VPTRPPYRGGKPPRRRRLSDQVAFLRAGAHPPQVASVEDAADLVEALECACDLAAAGRVAARPRRVIAPLRTALGTMITSVVAAGELPGVTISAR